MRISKYEHATCLLAGRASPPWTRSRYGPARPLVTAQNTVPFTVWVAARHLDDYPAAITACIAADGDIDTTSAVVGGIIAAYTGTSPHAGVPQTWLAAREPLPAWLDTARRPRRRTKFGSGRVRRWLSGAT
ncbi:ADP-ribosylglycohydrolase family protein [Nocardia sp. CDC186]|uniref:ADP-ribosylglycohydrolase family protein n=1 Tax=Nocardia implantans TaxID=3108168 RepID=A0ABU6B4F1_9NOCA|nr:MULTISPECIES: ADP-ribosylglycohydrolase family protein [unclassified Nocardia]MBF6196262.1 ADP-ribosylglycohydrolase family protein [Nocardia beijingensis]MEA3527774.1 ADP-ribosylglycohydrolase family protein [Nocardia sp. CDC192]MEB3514520.1 ADP-ribosylglycohydrolase family protein [Nocardia sp. CDC186]